LSNLLSLWTALYRFQCQSYTRTKLWAICFFFCFWRKILETYRTRKW